MNAADLKKSLKLFPSTISIIGKEDLLRQEAKELILEVFCPDVEMRSFNVDQIDGQGSKEHKLLMAEEPVSQAFRVVFINSQDPDQFLQWKGQSTIAVSTGKSFKESQLEVDCTRLYGKRLKHWLRSEARRQELQIDTQDVDTILAENPPNLRKLRDEILKLSLCSSNLNVDVIREVCYSSVHSTGWDIMKHVGAGDIKKAVDTLVRVRATGTSLLLVIAALQKTFLDMRVAITGDNLESYSDIEKERLMRLKGRFTLKTVNDSLDDIIDVERKIKSGDSDLIDIWLVSRLAKRAA